MKNKNPIEKAIIKGSLTDLNQLKELIHQYPQGDSYEMIALIATYFDIEIINNTTRNIELLANTGYFIAAGNFFMNLEYVFSDIYSLKNLTSLYGTPELNDAMNQLIKFIELNKDKISNEMISIFEDEIFEQDYDKYSEKCNDIFMNEIDSIVDRVLNDFLNSNLNIYHKKITQ